MIPDCLTRTAADDRAEAMHVQRTCRCEMENPVYRDHFGTDRGCLGCSEYPDKGEGFDAALAEIQRREAEAVFALVPSLGGSVYRDEDSLAGAASAAAFAAQCATNPINGRTLAQRATLLDAARALVKLALEVSASPADSYAGACGGTDE